MQLFFKVAGICAVLVGFLGAGALLEAHRDAAPQAVSYRFHPLEDGRAFDTVTGKNCAMTDIPTGFTTKEGDPACSSLQ